VRVSFGTTVHVLEGGNLELDFKAEGFRERGLDKFHISLDGIVVKTFLEST